MTAAAKSYRSGSGPAGATGGHDLLQHLFAAVNERIQELDKLLTRDTYAAPAVLLLSCHAFLMALLVSHVTHHITGRYWKFHHMWRAHMQTLVCMVCCLTFFSSKTIARPDHVCDVLVSDFPISHVTRHTSHITRHTSHITRHTSHVTRHTSHTSRIRA